MRAPPRRALPRRPGLAAFAALQALAAWAGGAGLVTGAIGFGDTLEHRLPFASPVVAGLALAAVVATPLTMLAWSAWTGREATDGLALIVGLALGGWIVTQLVVLRALSLLQPVFLGVGAFFVHASGRVHLGPRQRGLLLVGTGAIVVAAGVGLFPHVVERALSVASVVSLAALGAGSATVARGARDTLRGEGRLAQAVGVVAVLMVLVVVVWLVAPPVAATNVPPSEVTATPAHLGLPFVSVALTTADGVPLAAWYVRGSGAAAVVVLHGAGSTRSDVLAQAAVLVRNGYGVLLQDARGHGDSGGRAMDFGWLGDLDVAAGTTFLAARPEVDPDRIGVLGLSMGGEEAIGAAASDDRVRAVVAEGATARTAADKAWLSDAYGWRGWLQEQVEKVQYGITDLLTEASPPLPLRAAVAAASTTSFLLIAAGGVADERRAASFIQSAAPERVAVWTVAGAGHTGGLRARPEEWEQRVVAFFDDGLRP